MKIKSWELKPEGRPASKANSNFYTTDTDAWLKFELTGVDFEPEKVTVTLLNEYDKSLVSESVEVNGSEAEFYLRPEIIEHGGRWRVQLVFEADGKDYTSGIVQFDVGGHILDSEQPSLKYIENWNTFERYAKDFIEEIEVYRPEFEGYEREENKRVENEIERATAENTRVQNETSRAEAESNRESNEDERIESEDLREDAETTREENEVLRQSAETYRQSTFDDNETNRNQTFSKNEEERQTTFETNERERQTVVKLTVEQYNALEDKSERSLYVIVSDEDE